LIVIRRVLLYVIAINVTSFVFSFYIFSKTQVSFSGVSGKENETMSNDTPTVNTSRRRSSTLVIPEGKPTFSQPLETELFINENDPLT